VLLVNLNSVIWEVARFLSEYDVSLYLYDKDQNNKNKKINSNDVNTNFYLKDGDMNLDVCECEFYIYICLFNREFSSYQKRWKKTKKQQLLKK